jgi:pantothenate kinase-related protein Tda10
MSGIFSKDELEADLEVFNSGLFHKNSLYIVDFEEFNIKKISRIIEYINVVEGSEYELKSLKDLCVKYFQQISDVVEWRDKQLSLKKKAHLNEKNWTLKEFSKSKYKFTRALNEYVNRWNDSEVFETEKVYQESIEYTNERYEQKIKAIKELFIYNVRVALKGE